MIREIGKFVQGILLFLVMTMLIMLLIMVVGCLSFVVYEFIRTNSLITEFIVLFVISSGISFLAFLHILYR